MTKPSSLECSHLGPLLYNSYYKMVILSQLAAMLKLITKLEKWMVGFVFLSDWSTKLDLFSPTTGSYMFPFLLI